MSCQITKKSNNPSKHWRILGGREGRPFPYDMKKRSRTQKRSHHVNGATVANPTVANFLLLLYPSLRSNTKLTALPTLCIRGKLECVLIFIKKVIALLGTQILRFHAVFQEKFGKIICWCPPGELVPPPRGKSWIFHCLEHIEILQFCLKIYDLWRHPTYGFLVGGYWVDV